jgi:hypothetical protein
MQATERSSQRVPGPGLSHLDEANRAEQEVSTPLRFDPVVDEPTEDKLARPVIELPLAGIRKSRSLTRRVPRKKAVLFSKPDHRVVELVGPEALPLVAEQAEEPRVFEATLRSEEKPRGIVPGVESPSGGWLLEGKEAPGEEKEDALEELTELKARYAAIEAELAAQAEGEESRDQVLDLHQPKDVELREPREEGEIEEEEEGEIRAPKESGPGERKVPSEGGEVRTPELTEGGELRTPKTKDGSEMRAHKKGDRSKKKGHKKGDKKRKAQGEAGEEGKKGRAEEGAPKRSENGDGRTPEKGVGAEIRAAKLGERDETRAHKQREGSPARAQKRTEGPPAAARGVVEAEEGEIRPQSRREEGASKGQKRREDVERNGVPEREHKGGPGMQRRREELERVAAFERGYQGGIGAQRGREAGGRETATEREFKAQPGVQRRREERQGGPAPGTAAGEVRKEGERGLVGMKSGLKVKLKKGALEKEEGEIEEAKAAVPVEGEKLAAAGKSGALPGAAKAAVRTEREASVPAGKMSTLLGKVGAELKPEVKPMALMKVKIKVKPMGGVEKGCPDKQGVPQVGGPRPSPGADSQGKALKGVKLEAGQPTGEVSALDFLNSLNRSNANWP